MKTPTRVCKICFKEIKEISLNSIAKPQYSICSDCYNSLPLIYKKFCLGEMEGLALFEYDDVMRKLIYQYKGCFDYELKDIFLERFLDELKIKYHNYILVPVPSSKEHDAIRGFNHVFECFKRLGLPMESCIKKTKKMKQSDLTAEQRKGISEFLVIDKNCNLENKNILIVDDIMTTGSTLKACYSLLKQLKPKKINALVLCKTRDLDFDKNSNINKLY